MLLFAILLAGCRRDEDVASSVGEQLVVLGTIVGAIAALPALIEFLIDRRKRKERLDLSLEDLPVSGMKARTAGLEEILDSIADLIDRASSPQAYAGLSVGNEILIIGGNLAGKKTLARAIAARAGLDRLVIVYSPRNVDALAKAKSLIAQYAGKRIMLLLPRVDIAYAEEDDEVMVELDALVEATSELPHVLVVGTAHSLRPNSALDNAFGIKLLMPGTTANIDARSPLPPSAQRYLEQIALDGIQELSEAGVRVEGMSPLEMKARLLEVVSSPAEVRDIITLCHTLAIFQQRQRKAPGLIVTPDQLNTAIARVVVGPVGKEE